MNKKNNKSLRRSADMPAFARFRAAGAQKAARAALDILYPRRCPLCHDILKNKEDLACPDCIKKCPPISGSICFSCGKPVSEWKEYCPECEGKKRAFDMGRGIFPYNARLKLSILRFKNGGCREYARFYAAAAACHARSFIRNTGPDVIVPIPLYKKQYRIRGYNQAELFARELSEYCDIPYTTSFLIKTHETKNQKTLDARARKKNMKEAFAAPRPLNGLKILLVDDIYTTGATLEAAAGVLKAAGASKIYFLTIAIAL